MNDKGILAIISGPSAAGKGTVVRRAMSLAQERGLDIYLSVSMTSREMKKDEVDGETYFYVSREKFEESIKKGDLLEYNEYNGNYYGTPASIVRDRMDNGDSVILEIDVNGADQVVRECPSAVRIFIMPPSIRDLRDRIEKRGRDTAIEIEQRLIKAREEIPRALDYDYIIINDIIEEAAEDVLHIIIAEKNRAKRRDHIIDEILSHK